MGLQLLLLALRVFQIKRDFNAAQIQNVSSPPTPSPLYPLTLSQTPTCPRELHYCVTLPFTPWTVYYALFQVRQLQDLISKASPSVWASLERAINPEMKKGKPFTPLIRCSAIHLDMHGAGSGCAHVDVRSDTQCPCGPTAISWSASSQPLRSVIVALRRAIGSDRRCAPLLRFFASFSLPLRWHASLMWWRTSIRTTVSALCHWRLPIIPCAMKHR